MSKGDYVFPLDNDDMFFSENIFDYFLKVAINYNFDIVGFRAFQTSNSNNSIDKFTNLYNYESYPEKIIIFQPQLSTWIITINGKFHIHDVTIWAKCIKNIVYKNAINKLGAERYSKYVSWAEDTIVNYVIFV